jgi:predicted metal-dependent TIM-barrel fold hydrolase
MNNVDKLIQKLQAYKSLSDSNVRAIGEHLLPVAMNIESEIKNMRAQIKAEFDIDFMNMIVKAAEGKVETTYEYWGKKYVLSVKEQ